MSSTRRAAIRAKERSTLFATAIEQAAEGIVITDRTGTIQFVNTAFTAMTGYTSDEVIGQNPRILKSDHQNPAMYEELWRTILSGQIWHGELVNRRKDATTYLEQIAIAPLRNRAGEVTGFIASKRDVTESRAQEKAQSFLAALVENSTDAILSCSHEGVIHS